MSRRTRKGAPNSAEGKPQEQLLQLAAKAIEVAKTARRNKRSLTGANFYANRIAELRADATNAFTRLEGRSVGDTSALAELIEKVFSPTASPTERAQALRDIQFEIKTKWKDVEEPTPSSEIGGVFPLTILTQTGRGYLVSVGRQINGCYSSNWYDACAVMMRRLLESSIIEAFEVRGLDKKIKDPKSGDFHQLTALIDAALNEPSWNLPRGVKSGLRDLRDLGHRSAHNRYYLAKRPDVDKLSPVYRESVEAFLHLANLL